jgi:hypothetical protein
VVVSHASTAEFNALLQSLLQTILLFAGPTTGPRRQEFETADCRPDLSKSLEVIQRVDTRG